MAKRPIFIPKINNDQLVEERIIEFKWHPGMAISQKQKNVKSLHASAKNNNIWPVLEVSSKSMDSIGIHMSAFNLKLNTKHFGSITVESAFQGSKVFEKGGPYLDLFQKSGREIKKDHRLKESGNLKSFSFDGLNWELEPKTAFYDWIYLNALHHNLDYGTAILSYKGFTDIEFNPKKSINCQARSCALYVSFVISDRIEKVLKDRNLFLDILEKDSKYQPHSKDKLQRKLF